jgi:GGDEF domain-containing protein
VASRGVALGPGSLGTAEQVVAAADAAMYDAKRQGGRRCVLYNESRHAVNTRRRRSERAAQFESANTTASSAVI